MPNSFAGLAQRFPAEKEGQTAEEQVKELRDYSYQLLEYLRYALQHLDPSNFNEKEMEDWISKPIRAQIEDVNGNVSQLALTAEQLAVRMDSAEGNVSQLQLTAEALNSTITDQNGQISMIQQDAVGFQVQVADLSGKYAKLQATVDGFDIEGDLNNILTNDGVAQINFVFDDEKVGTVAGYGEGLLYIQSDVEMILRTEGNMALQASDDVDISSNNSVEISAGSSNSDRIILSVGDVEFEMYDTNDSSGAQLTGGDLWVDDIMVASSDERLKHDMTYDLDQFADLYRTLRPCRFQYNHGRSGRFHTGFIAQEVEQAISDAGFTDTDLAVVVQRDHGTENADKYGIRYSELIALNTAMIQKLMGEVDNLKAEIAELKGGSDDAT